MVCFQHQPRAAFKAAQPGWVWCCDRNTKSPQAFAKIGAGEAEREIDLFAHGGAARFNFRFAGQQGGHIRERQACAFPCDANLEAAQVAAKPAG